MSELDFTRVRHAVSNHIASAMMDASLFKIIFLSFMGYVQTHNVIYNWT